MHVRELWFVESVKEGDVVDGDGKPLRLRTLIARRWGWPKSASAIAADDLELQSHLTGRPWELRFDDAGRDEQQRKLFDRVEGLQPALLEGLAGRTTRERWSGRKVSSISVQLSTPVVEAGLVSRILSVIGDHVGCKTRDEVRDRALINVDDDVVVIGVGLGGLDVSE